MLSIKLDKNSEEQLRSLIGKGNNNSLKDVVSHALSLYLIANTYRDEGQVLMFENTKTKERVQLLIPGLER
jgi:hypothetical protein